MSAHLPLDPTAWLGAARPLFESAALLAYGLCQLGLALYSSHRYALLSFRERGRSNGPSGGAMGTWPGTSTLELPESEWPFVTLQFPVYNEPRVIRRLLEAAARTDYPRDRFEIQVLDDSDDATVSLAAAAIAEIRASGVSIEHLRRATRAGFKAGALAQGLSVARGELVAIFDADFVPPPEFLRRMVPHLRDPRVGMVQARWGHLNRDENALTIAQAVMLDAHFRIEHTARMGRGLFFNFNGTGGVWRRRCIEDSGGWSHATLTEDLDLSYRAQLRGWRFVFASDVVVPAELPADMQAFKSQQRRWTRGGIQTARLVLPAVLRAKLPLAVKLEAFFHLTSNVAYPLLLSIGVLLLPLLLGRSTIPQSLVWALQLGVLAFGTVPVAWFLARGQRGSGRSSIEVAREVGCALLLGAGIALNNAVAVVAGSGGKVGTFVRTPKQGDLGSPRVRGDGDPRGGSGEALLALYFAAVLAWCSVNGQPQALPFLGFLTLGCAWVAMASARPAELAVGRMRDTEPVGATAARSSASACP
ncbi:MAG: glycosyltransferase [Candidatus Eisenbacteria bacterium]|uniref:Glycosyltransferase n=1 Tax=Eiseniibacteriota bacterium TaxID=2212470 RepID=A0A849SQL8_UNCEI|nr:glycosyltransferase [Candidatus Eisenbacteria bacterium]